MAMEKTSQFSIASVVIPAHNEAAVIRRCLDELLSDFSSGELDVVVSCNGCTDDTADIVRSAWPAVRVIEIPQASKPAALRAADEALSTFPRIYLDADITLPSKSAKILIHSLRSGAIAARPRLAYETSSSDALVCSYYRSQARLQEHRNSLWPAVYGLSEVGRSRFSTFPDLIADDVFVSHWFKSSEIKVIDVDLPAIIHVQRRIRDLFRVARRRRKGNAEIYSLPDGPQSTASSTILNLLKTTRSGPTVALDTVFYFVFAIIVRISVTISPPGEWSRDESSRSSSA
jgi:glycosyltransferase involved in cell wall biosynthesis